MKDKFLIYLEFALFCVTAFFVFGGYVDGFGVSIPFSYEISSAIIFICLLVYGISFLKDVSNRISPLIASGISIVTIAASHLLLPEFNVENPVPVLYFIIMISCGLLGNIYTWIFPWLLFTIGEFIHFGIASTSPTRGINFNDISNYFNFNYLNMIYLFIAGLFPSIISSHLVRSILEKPQNEKSGNDLPPAQQRSDTTQFGTKTQSITATQTITATSEFTNDLKTGVIYGVNELLASVVYFMKRNFKAYSALAFTFDTSTQSFVLNSFQSKSVNIKKETTIPLGNGIIGKTGVDKRVFMSGDLSYYNSDLPFYSSTEEINSILAVPVVSDQNELLGALVLDSLDKHAFKDQDKEIMKRFATLAAALITNTRMRIFQEKAARTFQIFYETSHKLTTALNISDVFDVIFQVAPSIAKCTRQMAILFNAEKRSGMVCKILGYSPDIKEGLEFPFNNGLYSYAFQKRKIVNINDYQLYQTKYCRFSPGEMFCPNLRSLAIFPILDDESRCRGLYSIESDTVNEYTGETEQALYTIIENASVAFTRALLYQRMEKLATTDGLTELNNHRFFQELLSKEIERSRRYSTFTSLLLMDIDHFKTFNDTYGHPVGDLVLKEIAQCIRQSIRLNDIPARYGGEEFTVIIPETNELGASVIAERIRSSIENHIILSLDRQLHVTVSIGVATFPTMVSSQPQLIDYADKALYYSKENGRNRVTIYTQGMGGKKK